MLHTLPKEVLYRISVQLDTLGQRKLFTTNKALYNKWFIQREENGDDYFLLWCLQWLADRRKDLLDASRSGVTGYFVQHRFLEESDQALDPFFFETDSSFIESMAVLSHRGHTFPTYDINVFPTDTQAALWKKDESGQEVAGFGLVKYLHRPGLETSVQPVVFSAQSSKDQLLRRLSGAPPVHSAVLHLMTISPLPWAHLQQAAEQCYNLLCSTVWSRGQLIIYLEPCNGSRCHIIIDRNPDGSWAIDDRRSRNRPVIVNFQHIPQCIVEVRAFYYSPSANRFVDESEHDGCTCRAATEWDDDSKLFIYNQNINPVQ